MKKYLSFIFILSILFITPGLAMADYTIDIDGELDDWGPDDNVDPGIGAWQPYPGIFYTVEDFTGGEHGQVYPGWGGQQFDAEALYLYADDDTFYLALVTGFPLGEDGIHYEENGRVYSYSAGDIAIDFGSDGTYEYGIEIASHDMEDDSTYDGIDGIAGGLYKVSSWKETGEYPGSLPFYMLGVTTDIGAPIAIGDFELGFYDDDHWVWEMSLPKTAFGSDWSNYGTVHWTQTCGNDVIEVTANPVPEPMSMALFGTGALGMFFGLRRRKKRG